MQKLQKYQGITSLTDVVYNSYFDFTENIGKAT